MFPILAILATFQTIVPASPHPLADNVTSVARLFNGLGLPDVQPRMKPARESVTIFHVLRVEGGRCGQPVPVTITVTGDDSGRVLNQILERLGQKPVTAKP